MPFDRGESDVIGQLEALDNLSRAFATVVPAATATSDYEIPIYVAPSGGVGSTLSRLAIFAAAAITGAATNFQTLQFRLYRAGSLVGTFSGATTYVTTASLAALTEKKLFGGALALKPGDVITLQNVHTLTGADLPALTAVVEVSPSV